MPEEFKLILISISGNQNLNVYSYQGQDWKTFQICTAFYGYTDKYMQAYTYTNICIYQMHTYIFASIYMYYIMTYIYIYMYCIQDLYMCVYITQSYMDTYTYHKARCHRTIVADCMAICHYTLTWI